MNISNGERSAAWKSMLTPMQLIHGENDGAVPVGQSKLLYKPLKHASVTA